MLVRKYVDQNGSAAKRSNGSAAKRSAGVAPEVNLKIPLHTGDKAWKQVGGVHPGFESQSWRHQRSKKEYQCPHKKDWNLPKNSFKKVDDPEIGLRGNFRKLVERMDPI